MENRLKIEKILWRGPWLLVIIPEKMHIAFSTATLLAVYWGEECRVFGPASMFKPTANEDRDGVLINILEVCRGYGDKQPTRMEITLDNKKFGLPIDIDVPERDQKNKQGEAPQVV